MTLYTLERSKNIKASRWYLDMQSMKSFLNKLLELEVHYYEQGDEEEEVFYSKVRSHVMHVIATTEPQSRVNAVKGIINTWHSYSRIHLNKAVRDKHKKLIEMINKEILVSNTPIDLNTIIVLYDDCYDLQSDQW